MVLAILPIIFVLSIGLIPQAETLQQISSAEQASAKSQAPQSDRETLEKRGDVFMARKDYREAANTYRQAIQLDPRNAVLHNKLGISYQQQTRLNDAKKSYERAIKLNGKYSEAINNLGTIHYTRKKYGTAISQYQKALAIAPDSASIYSNLGTAWFARKKYDDAFAAYRKALELDPEVFEHKSTYGVLLQERSVEDRARFHYYLAKTYAAAGNLERALEYLKKALEEGFKEKDKIADDPSFVELIKTEPFAQLMANPPKVLPPQ
ncbi:MAG: tetratricopeptide repeat protein [Acidobacteria bacterium]|jgi:tetratricopeptide (TPR) repeat protein|nr:tetratricopeptide repeat protein [Acidobacteriota bacterium]